MLKYIFSVLLVLSISGCDFEFSGADEKFGTQNFAPAVSLIELHKTRNGEYPESLSDLEFLGDWDGIWLTAVKYEKAGDGYNLYLEKGWAGKPSLEFPIKFKQGLGTQKTMLNGLKNKHNKALKRTGNSWF